MSMIKRRMELQAEFAALNSQEVDGKNTALSRQFLRTLPLVNNPNFSRHNIVPVYTILVSMKDTLRSVVSSTSAERLAYKPTESQLMWEVELNVGHPIVLASFDFANSNSAFNAVEDYDEPLFLDLEQHPFSQELTLAINGFQKMLLGFSKTRFWHDWYKGFLDGKPVDWKLQRRVALIPDDIWDSGPEPVAAAIQEIEAEWAAEHLPQADRIILDEDTGKFDISPLALSPAEIVQTALEQVAFARGVAERSNCGFNTTSVAWEYIEFTLNSCRNNANAIEQNFEIARAEIADGLKNGTYFEDPKLAALERVLDTAVTDLRAHHPEVIEAWEKRVQVKLRIAQDDQKQLIVEKATELIAISSPTLGKELELDAKTISNSSGEAQGGAIRRFFGRVAQMRLIVRSSEIVKRIDASTGYKGTRVIQTLHSLVEMIIGLF